MRRAEARRHISTRAATKALLKREQFIGMVYEPLRADEGIIEAVHDNGNAVFSTSIDFLEYKYRDITNIICEPRPPLATAYARKAIELATQKVALLLPLGFLVGAEKGLFAELPLARVYVLSDGLSYRTTQMAWYVFEKGCWERPQILWILGDEYDDAS